MKKALGFTTALAVLTLAVPMFSNAATGSAPVISHQVRHVSTANHGGTYNFGWSSTNWSGYAITGSTYSDITGYWKVTSVAATSSSTYSSSWIGIDGYNNSDLIQTGTESDYYSGSAHYGAWWEILPAAETVINMSVKPGDRMYAHIHNNGNGTWLINLQDTTTGANFSTTQSYSGPGTSAEWIEEAPTVGGRQSAFAHYGEVTFDPGTVNGGNPNLNSNEAGYAVNSSNQAVSVPSNPDGDTDGFNVQYGSSTPAAPAS